MRPLKNNQTAARANGDEEKTSFVSGARSGRPVSHHYRSASTREAGIRS